MNTEPTTKPEPDAPGGAITFGPQIDKLIPALIAATAEIETPVKNVANPFFKSRYADLAEIRDKTRGPLLKHNLLLVSGYTSLDPVTRTVVDERTGEVRESRFSVIAVETRIVHASGQWVSIYGTTVCDGEGPQKEGSAITYLRRYQINCLLWLASEDDDDGNHAQGRPVAQAQAAAGGAPRAAQPAQRSATPAEAQELWDACYERTGDEEATRDLFRQVTSFPRSDGTEFPGYTSPGELRSFKLLKFAWVRLREHETFGDAALVEEAK